MAAGRGGREKPWDVLLRGGPAHLTASARRRLRRPCCLCVPPPCLRRPSPPPHRPGTCRGSTWGCRRHRRHRLRHHLRLRPYGKRSAPSGRGRLPGLGRGCPPRFSPRLDHRAAEQEGKNRYGVAVRLTVNFTTDSCSGRKSFHRDEVKQRIWDQDINNFIASCHQVTFKTPAEVTWSIANSLLFTSIQEQSATSGQQ